MTLTLMRYPTTLSSLRDDEEYDTYFRKSRKIIGVHDKPWMLMVHTTDDTWKRGLYNTFPEALYKLECLPPTVAVRDYAIISRPKLFKVPKFAERMTEPGDQWCGRCRRPSLFMPYGHSHPALKGIAPVIMPHENRCFFCGLREETAQLWTRTQM